MATSLQFGRFQARWHAHRLQVQTTVEDGDDAEARALCFDILSRLDVPLDMRGACYLMLTTIADTNEDAIQHARTAIDVLERCMRSGPAPAAKCLLVQARQALLAAEEGLRASEASSAEDSSEDDDGSSDGKDEDEKEIAVEEEENPDLKSKRETQTTMEMTVTDMLIHQQIHAAASSDDEDDELSDAQDDGFLPKEAPKFIIKRKLTLFNILALHH